MKTSIFGFKDYQDFLRQKLKESNQRGFINKLGEAAKCQHSHISRVLSGKMHLTMEQAYRLTIFFQFSEDEHDFFMKLVELGRCGDFEYRKKILRDLRLIKDRQEDLATRLQQRSLGSYEKEMTYYSSWIWSALHIMVSIPKYQIPSAIASKLHLSVAEVEEHLKTLNEFGLVKFESGKWKFSGEGLHLPKHSPLTSMNHSNWRQRAVVKSQFSKDDGVHYTIVQSISSKDFDRIKELILTTIDQYAQIAAPSKEEEIVCFTCDLFKI